MTVSEMIQELGLKKFHVEDEALNGKVTSAYCGDLLSDVMAHAPPDSAWFTIQGHMNTIAVAQLKDIICIVLVNGVEPDPQSLDKAETQKINICGSSQTSAALCMKLAGRL